MGQYISKIFVDFCKLCSNLKCYSSCCKHNIEMELETRTEPKNKDIDVQCCYGCIIIHKHSHSLN